MRNHEQVALPSLALALHELRGPLGFVASAARLMAGDAESQLLRDQCTRIERAATRMMVTARTVLSAAAEAPADTSECDLATSLSAVVEDMRWMGFSVELSLPPGPLPVCSAAEEFESLIASFLLNAGDHGDLAHPVKVTVHRGENALHVTIRNRCCAVPRHRGHGLGSLVVARLAARIGATVSAFERDGWFTATVALPSAAEHVSSESTFF
ncbi:MAG: hypothetical protein M0R74_18295 [Dehalococcoidia bacterium]|nr:hypothetical protein [Dehalococcoidia bacterium]